MKIVLGKHLIFISRIKRDGSGVEPVSDKIKESVSKEEFRLIRLSITEDTWIAANFNLYVVKINPDKCQHKRKELGYLAWNEWAELQHENGITQTQCPKCKLWLFPEEV